jgi:DNA-binding NtrC family response regulator
MQTTLSTTENGKCPDTLPKVRVMLVMSPERRGPLLESLDSCAIDLVLAADWKEARRIVASRPQVDVLLTNTTMRDEDWIGTYEVIARLPVHLQVVMCCGWGDHRQWLAALELGAYDVLTEPYEPHEIQRTLDRAAARSRMRWLAAPQPSPHTLWLSSEDDDGISEFHCRG